MHLILLSTLVTEVEYLDENSKLILPVPLNISRISLSFKLYLFSIMLKSASLAGTQHET